MNLTQSLEFNSYMHALLHVHTLSTPSCATLQLICFSSKSTLAYIYCHTLSLANCGHKILPIADLETIYYTCKGLLLAPHFVPPKLSLMSALCSSYQCDCLRQCKYLKNVSKATFYNHAKYRAQDRLRSSNALCLLFPCILTGSLCASLCLVGDAPSSHTQPDAARSLHLKRRSTNLSRSHSWAAMTPGKCSRSDSAHSTIG